MYIDATLLGGGNSIELRGDELWDVTMGEKKEKVIGTVKYSHHTAFVRESLIFLNEMYYNKQFNYCTELVNILSILIDWHNYDN